MAGPGWTWTPAPASAPPGSPGRQMEPGQRGVRGCPPPGGQGWAEKPRAGQEPSPRAEEAGSTGSGWAGRRVKGRSHHWDLDPEAEAGRPGDRGGSEAGAGPTVGGGGVLLEDMPPEGPGGSGAGLPRPRGSPRPQALRLKGQHQFGAPGGGAGARDGSAGGGVTPGRRPVRWEGVGPGSGPPSPPLIVRLWPEAAPARAGGARGP